MTRQGLKRVATALAAGTTLAMTAGASPAFAAPPTQVTITAFGAIAGDGQDDSEAIGKAIAAVGAGGTVTVPAGTFQYNKLIELEGKNLAGTGPNSVLHATNPALQAVVVRGSGVKVSDLQLTTVPVTDRLSTPESTRIYVQRTAANFRVENMTIVGSSSGGIMVMGSHGVVQDNVVRDTLADGIHMTGLANDVVVKGNRCIDNHDDQIAVVSYDNPDKVVVSKVRITDNDVSGGHARGITISGGSDIVVEKNNISNTGAAGIFIASEGGWRTLSVKGLAVRKNTVTKDSQNPAVPEKGGIRIQATYLDPSVSDVLIEKNDLNDSGDSGVMVVGTSRIDNVTLAKNDVRNPALYGIRIVSTVTGKITFTKNKVTGSAKAPFSNASQADIVTDMPNDPDAGSGGSGETYLAGHGSPVIDGKVDAIWSSASPLRLTPEPSGTTGVARVMWDDKGLHYLYEMVDATPFANGSAEHNDSVEAWTDELYSRHGTPTTGDYQVRVDLKNAVTTSTPGGTATGVTSAVQAIPGGYIVEFTVPYRALQPAAGKKIGFNASANDDTNGDGKRDAYLSWVDKNLPYWADTRVYGTLELAP